MTPNRQPSDPEGGIVLFSPDGNLVIRRLPSGYRIIATSDTDEAITLDARPDDMAEFSDKLGNMIRGDHV